MVDSSNSVRQKDANGRRRKMEERKEDKKKVIRKSVLIDFQQRHEGERGSASRMERDRECKKLGSLCSQSAQT